MLFLKRAQTIFLNVTIIINIQSIVKIILPIEIIRFKDFFNYKRAYK